MTCSRKFLFADDLAIALQYGYDINSEKNAIKVLNEDLEKLSIYYSEFRLSPNLEKTEVTTFYLSNRFANRKINLTFRGKDVPYNFTPKHLGITLDRSLTFRRHLRNVRGKLNARLNIIQKLAGSMWGCMASTLRVSSLSLVYSTAEYCCPVRNHSTNVNLIDASINSCLRAISGVVESTPTEWLPVLSNIKPAEIRFYSRGTKNK